MPLGVASSWPATAAVALLNEGAVLLPQSTEDEVRQSFSHLCIFLYL